MKLVRILSFKNNHREESSLKACKYKRKTMPPKSKREAPAVVLPPSPHEDEDESVDDASGSDTSSLHERKSLMKEECKRLKKLHKELIKIYGGLIRGNGELRCEDEVNGGTIIITKTEFREKDKEFCDMLTNLSKHLSKGKKTSTSVQFCVVADKMREFLESMCNRLGISPDFAFVDRARNISEKKNLISNLFAIYCMKFAPSMKIEDKPGQTQARIITNDPAFKILARGDSMFKINKKDPSEETIRLAKPNFFDVSANVTKRVVNRGKSPIDVLMNREPGGKNKVPIISVQSIAGNDEIVIQFGFLPSLEALLTVPVGIVYDDDFTSFGEVYATRVAELKSYKADLRESA